MLDSQNLLFYYGSITILRNIQMGIEKVFLIINSYYIGDILLVNPLVQNIKRIYKDSKIVMITSPNLVDVAKYQEGVDDVIVWDRHGKDKGFFNMMKFIFKFPYKNIYASFPIYSGDRAIMLSALLRAKYILGFKNNIMRLFMKSKFPIINNYDRNIQLGNTYLLSGLTKEELIDYPIKFNLPKIESDIVNQINKLNGDYIVFCPKSSNKSRDMENKQVLNIIEKYNGTIVLIGQGQNSQELSTLLEKNNYSNLINLINKTTILESFYIIKNAKCCVTVNTGMLHASTAFDKKLVGIFYEDKYSAYQPSKEIYPNSEFLYNETDEKIIETINSLTKEVELVP